MAILLPSSPKVVDDCTYNNTNNPFYGKYKYSFVHHKPKGIAVSTTKSTLNIILHPTSVKPNQAYLIMALYNKLSTNKKQPYHYLIEFNCDEDCYLIWMSSNTYLDYYTNGGLLSKVNAPIQLYKAGTPLEVFKDIKLDESAYLLMSKEIPERYIPNDNFVQNDNIYNVPSYTIKISHFA